MQSIAISIRCWWQQSEGQDLVEYALLAALIAVACIASLALVGDEDLLKWDYISGELARIVGGG